MLCVEVESVEKNCKVIVNLEHIVEIAPLVEGGCAIFFADGAATGGVRSMKVKDSYEMFKQFAMQTVTGDMIAERIQSIQASIDPPPKSTKKDKKTPVIGDLEIPVFK